MVNSLSQRPRLDFLTRAVVASLWIALGIFVLYPAFRLLWLAFWVNGSLSLANFAPVITNWYDRMALWNSLLLGGAVAVSGTLLGFAFAYAVTRLSLPSWFSVILGSVSMLPLISPPFTLKYWIASDVVAWSLFFLMIIFL